MRDLEKFISKHSDEIQRIKTEIATNFEAPAQRIINAGFARMNASRFDSQGNDLWEMIACHLNGWEYENPPAHLVARWQRGSALTPVIGILTVFTIGAVLIAQSGLVNALVARFAQVFNG